MTKPSIGWYNSAHSAQVVTPFNFGVIDAGDVSNPFTFNIWNNKGGVADNSKMEDCTITTRDMAGGLGSTHGSEVQAVSGDWFHAQVDTLSEVDLTLPSSKIGASASKPIGTTGTTKHLQSLTASAWVGSTPYTLGNIVKPTVGNGYIYECTQAGSSGGVEPVWKTTADDTVNDGTTIWKTIKIDHKPNTKELMGVQNDGTPTNSAGNFATVTLQCDVPLDANAGRQDFKVRVSYRYT